MCFAVASALVTGVDVLLIIGDMRISLFGLSTGHCRRPVAAISRRCPDNSDTIGDVVTGPSPLTVAPVTVEVRRLCGVAEGPTGRHSSIKNLVGHHAAQSMNHARLNFAVTCRNNR
jgi:hypothetical protein